MVSTAEKIREYLAKGLSPKEISKRLKKVKVAYVYQVRWNDKQKTQTHEKAPNGAAHASLSNGHDRESDLGNAVDSQYPLGVSKLDALEKVVDHPPYYLVGGIETQDFIEAKNLSHRLGNVVEYISRADYKGERLKDLMKAKWYLDREIRIEKAKIETLATANA